MSDQCWFTDICKIDGRLYCHYEMLILGSNPCKDCEDIDSEEAHNHEI